MSNFDQKSIFCFGIAIFVDRAYQHYIRGYNFPIQTTLRQFSAFTASIDPLLSLLKHDVEMDAPYVDCSTTRAPANDCNNNTSQSFIPIFVS